jgi:hypothetical protein
MKSKTETHDEVETSSGITPTSPTPLTARPAALKVDEVDDPGAVNAPRVAVESAKSAHGNEIPEYIQAAHDLPQTITARQVQADDSNPTGCEDSGWRQR